MPGFDKVVPCTAFAVVLFLMVMPIVIYNARQLKKQKEIR